VIFYQDFAGSESIAAALMGLYMLEVVVADCFLVWFYHFTSPPPFN
jgi:hypothetical protein